MNTALRCEDPVWCSSTSTSTRPKGPGPVDDWDYCLPVGRAAVRREGSDLTILTYLGDDVVRLEAVDGHAVDAEVIDLRWLDRASIDWETIEASLAKTNQVLIAEQGAVGTSYGGVAGRRDPTTLLRPARRAGPSGDRRRRFAQHQQGARARRDRADRRGHGGPRRDRAILTWPALLRLPEVSANATEAVLAEWLVGRVDRLHGHGGTRDGRNGEGSRRHRGRRRGTGAEGTGPSRCPGRGGRPDRRAG